LEKDGEKSPKRCRSAEWSGRWAKGEIPCWIAKNSLFLEQYLFGEHRLEAEFVTHAD
jgi:hypothetical protein